MTVFTVPHDVLSRWRGETLWSDVREMLVGTDWPLPSQLTGAPQALMVLSAEAHRSDSLDWVDRGLALRLVFWLAVWVIAIALLLVVVQFGPTWAGGVGLGGFAINGDTSSRPSMVFFAPIVVLLGAIVVSMYGPRILPSGHFRKARLPELLTATSALCEADFVWDGGGIAVQNLPSANWLQAHHVWVADVNEGLSNLHVDADEAAALSTMLVQLRNALVVAEQQLATDVSAASRTGHTIIEVDRRPIHPLLATVDELCGRLEPSRRWLPPIPVPFPDTL